MSSSWMLRDRLAHFGKLAALVLGLWFAFTASFGPLVADAAGDDATSADSEPLASTDDPVGEPETSTVRVAQDTAPGDERDGGEADDPGDDSAAIDAEADDEAEAAGDEDAADASIEAARAAIETVEAALEIRAAADAAAADDASLELQQQEAEAQQEEGGGTVPSPENPPEPEGDCEEIDGGVRCVDNGVTCDFFSGDGFDEVACTSDDGTFCYHVIEDSGQESGYTCSSEGPDGAADFFCFYEAEGTMCWFPDESYCFYPYDGGEPECSGEVRDQPAFSWPVAQPEEPVEEEPVEEEPVEEEPVEEEPVEEEPVDEEPVEDEPVEEEHDPDAPGPASVTVLEGTTVVAGSTITLTGAGWLPGSTVTIEIFSAPILLGTANVDANGQFSTQVTIPASLSPGTHTLVMSGLDIDGLPRRVSIPMTILAIADEPVAGTDPAPSVVTATGDPTPTAALAATGASTFMLLLVSVSLVIVGAMMVATSRRVRPRSHALT